MANATHSILPTCFTLTISVEAAVYNLSRELNFSFFSHSSKPPKPSYFFFVFFQSVHIARKIGTTHRTPTMEKTSPAGAKRKPIPKNMDANETKAKATATAIIQSATVALALRRITGETNRSCSKRRLPFDQNHFPIKSRES